MVDLEASAWRVLVGLSCHEHCDMAHIASTTNSSPAPVDIDVIVPTPAPLPTPVVNILPGTEVLMDRVWPVLIGALIALLGSLLVQAWLVPLVDARKRREQRWEDDLLALGEVLTLKQPAALATVRAELQWQTIIADPPPEADHTKLRVLEAEHKEALRSAFSDLDQVGVQVDWLAERVASIGPRHGDIMKFLRSRITYKMADLDLFDLRYPADDARPSEDEVKQKMDAMRVATRDLVELIKKLAASGPPRSSRLKHAFSKVRAKWRKVWKKGPKA